MNYGVNSALVTLTFDETVDAASVNPREVTIQNAATATASVQLTGGVVSSTDSTVITIQLLDADLNRIKADDLLVTSTVFRTITTVNVSTVHCLNGYVRLTAAAAKDTSNNAVNAVADGSARVVRNYNEDRTAPVLTAFALNMSDVTILLTFSETVRLSTIDPTQVGIQGRIDAVSPDSFLLRGGQVVSLSYTVVKILIMDDDIVPILLVLGNSPSASTTFIVIASAFIQDMNKNAITAIASPSALAAWLYVPDTVKPVLAAFTLNMNTGVIECTFMKPVHGPGVQVSGVILQSMAAATGVSSYALTTSTTSQRDRVNLQIYLSQADMNGIKRLPALARTVQNTYLRLLDSAVKDTNGLGCAEIDPASAVQASAVSPDITTPVMAGFDLNMNSGIVTISFDEVIDVSVVQPTRIVIYGAANFSHLIN